MLTVDTLKKQYSFSFSDDDRLFWDNILETAKASVFKYIGLTDKGHISATYYFTNLENEYFVLPYSPLISIESVKCGTYDELVNGKGEVIKNYIVDNQTGILTIYDKYKIYHSDEKIRVDYTAGYTDETLPKPLEVAIVYTVRNIAKLLQTENLGVSALSADGTDVQTQEYIPFAIYNILKNYTIWRIK